MSRVFGLTIEAIDTLMFRDGRPFNQSDAGAGQARSVFPPFPPTVVGATRLMLARQLGFDGNNGWPTASLGDGVDWRDKGRLGPLEFSAPMLLRNDAPLFPAPLFLASTKEETIVRLRPGAPRACDLGAAVRLPEPEKSVSGIKILEQHWLSRDLMERVLSGSPVNKDQIVAASGLWQWETRVGIGRDRDNRVANTGQIYLASHVRPREGVSLGVNVSGLAAEPNSCMQALAGEHRIAEFRPTAKPFGLPSAPSRFPDGRYFVSLLSPALVDALPGPSEGLADLPGVVVSACLGKPVRIGGWDSQRREPIPLREAIPAGSTWFLQASERDDIAALNGKHLGLAREWGFGQFLVGRWDD